MRIRFSFLFFTEFANSIIATAANVIISTANATLSNTEISTLLFSPLTSPFDVLLSDPAVTGAVVCVVSTGAGVVVCGGWVVVVVICGVVVTGGTSVCDGSAAPPKPLFPPYPVGSNGIQPKSSL